MSQSFELEVLKIASHLKKYRETSLQQSVDRFASLDNLDREEVESIESGQLHKASAKTLLIYLDKMNLLSDFADMLNRDDDQLDQMADFIHSMEKNGHL